MLATAEPAPNPPPLPIVMGDDPCAAASGAADPSGARYYYRARYYDPKVGRFISEDPARLREGGTYYSYVKNSPTSLRDPSGLYTILSGSQYFRARVTDGFTVLRDKLEGACDCRDYFREQRNPLFRELLPTLVPFEPGSTVNHVPKVFSTPGSSFKRGSFGATLGTTTNIFLNADWVQAGPVGSEMASILLHELGHLARESDHDDDDSDAAREFFRRCTFGGVNPRYE